jgi:NitT/TauT family transport system permease protein
MRISVGAAWMLTVTAEMVAVKSGLGYALWDTYYFLRYDMVIAAMVSIGLIGYASDLLVKAFSRRVLAWQHASTLETRRGA